MSKKKKKKKNCQNSWRLYICRKDSTTYRIKSLKTITFYTNSTCQNDGFFFISFNRLKVVSWLKRDDFIKI